MSDTIYALSSGSPPAAIGVIRISGRQAGAALKALAGREFEARRPSLAPLRDASGALLDTALILWFPGKQTATGEDLAELHCHGGRAVIAAVEKALSALPGLRCALPGEFTRRAFANGRIDLAEAEGLADLLEAETEMQRASAMAMASGAFSHQVDQWRSCVLKLSARIESALDFSDEEDVSHIPPEFESDLRQFAGELEAWLDRPAVERLREGFRVVLAGPPNSGKSTLFNALVESEAAITSPQAGTTRDVIERSVAIEGVLFTFVDTAGLRSDIADEIESEGIARAQSQLENADLVLWLGGEREGPLNAWEIEAKCDDAHHEAKSNPRHILSAKTGEGLSQLKASLMEYARQTLPAPGEAALNARQRQWISQAHTALSRALPLSDLLLVAEELRSARLAFDQLTGRAAVEDMLDSLFSRFCIGK